MVIIVEKIKNDNIDIIVNDKDELIIDFNLIDVCFDVPDIETPDLTDEF